MFIISRETANATRVHVNHVLLIGDLTVYLTSIVSRPISYVRFALVVMLLALATGCATTYKVEPELVADFKPESTPKSDDTYVYVIRQENFQGGGRSVWVALDDEVVGRLGSGEHMLIKTKAGIHTVNLVQSLVGFGYQEVDNRDGETVFLYFSIGEGMKEVDADLGKSMVMQTKQSAPIDEVTHNDGYDNGLLNPSRLGIATMTKADELLTPSADNAVVTIFRDKDLIAEIPFGIWNQDGWIGDLKGGEYTQVQLAPGKHRFIGLGESYAALEAMLEAGKEYIVQLHIGMGWNEADVDVNPVDGKKDQDRIAEIKETYTYVMPDKAVVQTEALQTRLDAGMAFIAKAVEEVESGELEKTTLSAEAGM